MAKETIFSKRMTIELSQKDREILEEMCAKSRESKITIIRRAIRVLHYIYLAETDHYQLCVREGDKIIRDIVTTI